MMEISCGPVDKARAAELAALLPSILGKAFKGDL